ncbi:MAG: YdcF family protein [Desulfobacterales bacterium]|jgi:uncharacterized SAM-binding protein YcdF (DUF218 family)
MKSSTDLHDPEGLSTAEVIIVLGARVFEGGIPSPTLERRVLHAVNLYRKWPSKFLLVTGGIGRHPPSESSVMKQLAQAKGVSSNRIIMEDCAASTMQNAAGCARIMQQYGWSRAIIVTDRYHLKRSLLAFRHFGISAVGSPTKGKIYAARRPRWWYFFTRELFALGWYWIRVKSSRPC